MFRAEVDGRRGGEERVEYPTADSVGAFVSAFCWRCICVVRLGLVSVGQGLSWTELGEVRDCSISHAEPSYISQSVALSACACVSQCVSPCRCVCECVCAGEVAGFYAH